MLHPLVLSFLTAALVALLVTVSAPAGTGGTGARVAFFTRRLARYVGLWWAMYLAGWILSHAWAGAGSLGTDHLVIAAIAGLCAALIAVIGGLSAARVAGTGLIASVVFLASLACVQATLGVPGHG